MCIKQATYRKQVPNPSGHTPLTPSISIAISPSHAKTIISFCQDSNVVAGAAAKDAGPANLDLRRWIVPPLLCQSSIPSRSTATLRARQRNMLLTPFSTPISARLDFFLRRFNNRSPAAFLIVVLVALYLDLSVSAFLDATLCRLPKGDKEERIRLAGSQLFSALSWSCC